MLDQLRRDIKTRLDDLLGEAAKLRKALTALGSDSDRVTASTPAVSSATRTRSPRRNESASGSTASSRATSSRARSKKATTAALAGRKTQSRKPTGAAGSGSRTASGATKRGVLATLATGNAMTAGEIATATGLSRASVSTTLSRLAKSGELTKVARGYQLAQSTNQAATSASTDSPSQ
jgi:biotin operon repressor